MLARYRFAASAALSCGVLAGSSAFAQDQAPDVAAPLVEGVVQGVVELQLTAEADAPNATVLYSIQAEQGLPVGDAEVADEGTDAEAPAGLWLGVQLATEIPPALAHHLKDAKGALVETVYPESPAAESGMEAHDLIVRVGEADVESHEQLVEAMKNVEAKPIDVVILRGGEEKTLSVTPRERATARASATVTAEANDQLFYSLNVPHVRMLPALSGPDAGAMHHRLVQTFRPGAKLPEKVESIKIHVERDGETLVHRVEVTTTDGKTFKAANDEEMKALPPEIRAALPIPPNTATFALMVNEAAGAPQVQKQITLRAAPATVLPPQIAIPAPAPVTLPAAPWVDIVGQLDPAVGGAVTQRTVRIAHPGVELSEVKKELSELRASVDRIEKLLRKDEE